MRASAFAAIGEQAVRITAPHPIDPPHDLNSPVGQVYELDGRCFCSESVMISTRPFIWLSRWQVFGTGGRSTSPGSRKGKRLGLTTRRSTTVVRTSVWLIGGLRIETFIAKDT